MKKASWAQKVGLFLFFLLVAGILTTIVFYVLNLYGVIGEGTVIESVLIQTRNLLTHLRM